MSLFWCTFGAECCFARLLPVTILQINCFSNFYHLCVLQYIHETDAYTLRLSLTIPYESECLAQFNVLYYTKCILFVIFTFFEVTEKQDLFGWQRFVGI